MSYLFEKCKKCGSLVGYSYKCDVCGKIEDSMYLTIDKRTKQEKTTIHICSKKCERKWRKDEK